MLVLLRSWLSPFILVFLFAFAAALGAAAVVADRLPSLSLLLWLGVSLGAALLGGALGLWLYRRLVVRRP